MFEILQLEMCRICLKTKEKNQPVRFIPIFEHFELNELVANLIIDCADIMVKIDDDLPENICDDCLRNLLICCNFQKLIRKSDQVLVKMFGTSMDSFAKNTTAPKEIDYVAETDMNTPQNIKMKAELELFDTGSPTFSYEYEISPVEVIPKIEQPTNEESLDQTVAERPSKRELPAIVHYCCMCPITFTNKTDLDHHAFTNHIKYSTRTQRLLCQDMKECDLCGKKFKNIYALNKHRLRYKMTQQCPICGLVVPNQRIKQHTSTHEPIKYRKPEFQCDICGKKVTCKNSIKQHMQMHENKFFKCPECGKLMQTQKGLENHLRQHEINKQEPMFACNICPKKFYREDRTIAHMRIHTGEKPFSCQYCPLKFTDRTDHRRHEWSHTGSSPYRCRRCNKMFTRKNHLVVHEVSCIK